ncbi:hypothetical protein MKZ02_20275 [Pseudobacillus sp. FSL P4-0506]|uniref:hypothetical protein n=1 Tax=Pseudobacillus sp. FSL P4-0506 TaxID=2921576 RepID=UPI0030F667A1
MMKEIQQAEEILASNKPWGKVNVDAQTDMEALRYFAEARTKLGLNFRFDSSETYSAMVAEKDNLRFTIFFPPTEQEKAALENDLAEWMSDQGFMEIDVPHYEMEEI